MSLYTYSYGALNRSFCRNTRILYSLLLPLYIHGCSWVTRDYVYVPSTQSAWRLELRQGEQKNVKEVPIPDEALVTFESRELSIQVSAGYTLTRSVGPLWFPVIPSPTGSLQDERFLLTLLLQTSRQDVVVDVPQWKLTVNGREEPSSFDYQLYFLESGEIYSNAVSPDKTAPVHLPAQSRTEVLLILPIRPTMVNEVHIEFSGMSANGRLLRIPVLLLKKQTGNWNYDEFTL